MASRPPSYAAPESPPAERRAPPGNYREVVETSLQGILIQDHRRIRYANPAGARLFGYDRPDELVGENWDRLVAIENLPIVRACCDTCRAGESSDLNASWQGIRRDGNRIWLESVMRPISWEGRPAVLLFLTDISPRRRLEDQLRQAQKMQAMGRLAGGVAHDFNNLLTVIMGYSEIMRSALGPADPLAGLLEQISKAGHRASHLTRQLLAFSRKRTPQPVSTDLNILVADMEKMLVRLIGEDVKLEVRSGLSLWRVKVDPGHIEQVVMNLTVNARDAMPQGGNLIIETANVELGQPRTDNAVRPYVMLAVSDTGCGMDTATRARLFEPFFTTKDPGKGTGLGLTTVSGIVKESGGHIHVFSEPGMGTTFKIYLPRNAEMTCSAHADSGIPPPRSGSETLLLVEDDPEVRGLARTVLVSYGYTVLEANDGTEALQISEAHSGSIDLVVSDVVLPNLGGGRLAERLRARYPNLRVLFLSGYTDEAILHHGIHDVESSFMQKPFQPEMLACKVREVLDAELPAP